MQNGHKLNVFQFIILEKKSLMMIACNQGNLGIVQQMLKYDIEIQQKDSNNRNCLFYAIQNKKKNQGLSILNYILDKFPNIINIQASNNNTLLIHAIDKEKYQIAKSLIQRGANLNLCVSDTLDTALHIAVKSLKKTALAERVYKPIIKSLLWHGADYNIKNKQGKTALYMDLNFKEFLQKQIDFISIQKKRKTALYNINNTNDLENLFKQAQIHINQWKNNKIFVQNELNMKKSQDIIKVKRSSSRIPIDKLYLNSEELQNYLECQIKENQLQIQDQSGTDRKIIANMIIQIQSTLNKKGLKHRIQLFGSYATQLNMKMSDINLALITKQNIINSQEEQIIKIKDILQNLPFVQNIKCNGSLVKISCNQNYNRKCISMSLIFNQSICQQTVTFIKQYIKQYPQIKSLFYVLKNFLFQSKLTSSSDNSFSLNSYGLFIIVASFVQNQYQYKLPQNSCNAGRLLINFFKYFGYQFDYILKVIYLPKITDQNKFIFMPKYFNLPEYYQPKLIIMDPFNQNNYIGASSIITRNMQSYFKAAYVEMHINYNCKTNCKIRMKIQQLNLGRYEHSYRPCCILKRIYKTYKLINPIIEQKSQ